MARQRPQLQLPYNDPSLGPLFERREEAPAPAPPAPSRVVQDFAERRAARIERMRQRAARLARESEASRSRRQQIGDRIPMGQPILVGHHSERRHRKDIARIDSLMRKEVESRREAEDVARRVRAAEAGRGGISSDDPEAVRLLREKLAKTEDLRDKTLEINKIIRRGASDEEVLDLFRGLGWRNPQGSLKALRSMGQQTISTTNLSAEIRRIKARIQELEQKRSTPARASEEHGDVRIEEANNRVRIYFPGKPSAEVRSQLKSHGFRWSPTEGAWQRMASAQAWYAARSVIGAPQRDRGRRPRSAPARRDPLDFRARRWFLLDQSLDEVGSNLTEKQAFDRARRIADRYGKTVYVFEEDVTERYEVHPHARPIRKTARDRAQDPRRDADRGLRHARREGLFGRAPAPSSTMRRHYDDAARSGYLDRLSSGGYGLTGTGRRRLEDFEQQRARRSAPRRDPRPRPCPVGTRVQSLILSKIHFDRIGAINWVVDNGHRARKIDENEQSYRFRQEEPDDFVDGSFRTIELRAGVKAVIGCPAPSLRSTRDPAPPRPRKGKP